MIVPKRVQAPSAVAAHYDELDRFYREVWGEHVHHGLWRTGRETPREAVEQLVDFMAEEMRIESALEICDVGCGYGASAQFLYRTYGARVTGVTLSRSQWEYAYDEVLDPLSKVEIKVMDWLANDFASETFDALYAIESTEHMADKQAFFDEAFRTMKHGARLGVYAWLHKPDPPPWQVRHLLEPICREGRLAGMGTSSEYRAMAEQAGFEIRAFHELSDQVARTWHISIRRFLGKALTDASYLRYIFDSAKSERIFVLTVLRILAAYRLGAMQYGLLVAFKP